MSRFIDVPGRGDCLPRDDVFGSEFAVYEETQTVYPRSQWESLLTEHVGLEGLVKKIKDQKQEGTCASNAALQCFEIAWNLAMGTKHWIEMSPISIYRWIANNSQSGSTISGNLRQLRDVGCLPVDKAENKEILRAAGLPDNHVLKTIGYSQPFPANWKDTAKFFRALEFLDISSFEGFVSALFEGFPVCYGRAGHAICGARVVRRSNVWTIKYANSYSPQWGESGYGYDTESYISGAIRSYGAWALRCPVLTDQFLALTEIET